MMADSVQLWAGVECTVNRVGYKYFNQCQKSGHSQRLQDLELFAELGIQRIRYPFLWEQAAPNLLEKIDWSWMDERAHELRRLSLKPIAGLLHHGSGPVYTSLIDLEFPEKFAYYARRFAERYAWIEDYTPINEPLTTARFSGLYGVWYPHHRQDSSFVRALYQQTRATILAMGAIREINPKARLIQTEDIGRTQGTELLAYQVDFENHRRWLSFDLLCGKVNPQHPLYNYLLKSGLSVSDLQWLVDHSCPPDVLGLNHYVLSNRFLDHRIEHYPEVFHGGNGRHRYADVGAVDSTATRPPSPKSIFREAWDRYRIPIAVTEVHLHGPRESQIRWFHEIWKAINELKAEGVEAQAITAWSLLGTYDWNSLCTESHHFYESGIFDNRSIKPRPTALAKMIKSFSRGQKFEHPLLNEPGWWLIPERAPFGPRSPQAKPSVVPISKAPPLLITGATGTLGQAFAKICGRRNIPYRLLTRQEMDIANWKSVSKTLASLRPWAVINAAGYVRVDQAEADKENCFRENVIGPENLAQCCADANIPLLNFSSDLVFDGSLQAPYLESHPVSPVNVYGHSKAEAERRVLNSHPQSLIVRTSSFFGPWDTYNFVYAAINCLTKGHVFRAPCDVTVSPTYIPDLADACIDLLIDGESGLVHLTNDGHATWEELALKVAEIAERSPDLFLPKGGVGRVLGLPVSEMNFQARRPAFSALASERIKILPSYHDALERYFRDLEIPILSKLSSKFENSREIVV
jgi:dTDP-4-dehydrorhamnose reductase